MIDYDSYPSLIPMLFIDLGMRLDSPWTVAVESGKPVFSSVSPEQLGKGVQLGKTNGNTQPIRGVQKLLSDVHWDGYISQIRSLACAVALSTIKIMSYRGRDSCRTPCSTILNTLLSSNGNHVRLQLARGPLGAKSVTYISDIMGLRMQNDCRASYTCIMHLRLRHD